MISSLLFPCVSSIPQLCHHSRARPLTVNNQAADPPSHSPSIQIQPLPCFVEKFNLERLKSWIGIQNQDVGNRFSFSGHLPVQLACSTVAFPIDPNPVIDLVCREIQFGKIDVLDWDSKSRCWKPFLFLKSPSSPAISLTAPPSHSPSIQTQSW